MISRIAKNARLGDGMLVGGKTPGANKHLAFMSTDLSLLQLKRRFCIYEGYCVRPIGTQSSGYGGTKTIYNFYTRVDSRITAVANMDMPELLRTVDKVDLFLWHMDDGSWHKTANTIHLYCNMLNDEEASILCDQIEGLYGIRPRVNKDRKRDGRSFNYLYFPRKLTQLFRPEFKDFAQEMDIQTMFYKFGGPDYYDAGEEAA